MNKLLLPCLAATLFVPAVRAQTVISSVPYAISASGKYVLGGNLNNTTYGAAIRISAPNMQLDLNGFYVSGTGDTNRVLIPVILVDDVANVAIHNGLIANESIGILFNGQGNARNYIVENMIISRCYMAGIQINYAAPTHSSATMLFPT